MTLRRVFAPNLRHHVAAIRTGFGWVWGGLRPQRAIPTNDANYNFVTPVTSSDPLSGQILLADGNTGAMWISYTGASGTDYEDAIRALVRFDRIAFGGATWEVSSNTANFYDTYRIVSVSLITGPVPADALYAVTLSRPGG